MSLSGFRLSSENGVPGSWGVPFAAPTSSSSQMSVTPDPGGPMPSSCLYRGSAHMCIDPHLCTKFKNNSFFFLKCDTTLKLMTQMHHTFEITVCKFNCLTPISEQEVESLQGATCSTSWDYSNCVGTKWVSQQGQTTNPAKDRVS